MTFENLEIIEPVLRALNQAGYSAPTPIQQQAIPIILNNHDVLGCAQTGTGKTAAFSIPIIQNIFLSCQNEPVQEVKVSQESRLKKRGRGPGREIKALVLTPTRELAVQIDESFSTYGRYTGLVHTVVFGGVGQRPQTDALRRGVDVLIATPGRLLDLMGQGYVDLRSVQFLVLDEADRMLDMGFINDIRKVVSTLPSKRQTLLFSATMPDEIAHLAESILRDPVRVEVTPVSSTVDTIEQYLYYADRDEKLPLLVDLLKDESKESVLVFSRTKHGADRIAKGLMLEGIKSDAIHGNKSQSARQAALNMFKSKKIRVLIATDIASRGIDINRLSHVINYDLPEDPESYVHRIGRTGRAGMSGIALSFCDNKERSLLKSIQKLIGKKLDILEHEVTKRAPRELKKENAGGGERAERVAPRGDRSEGRDRAVRSDRSDRGERSDRGYRGERNERAPVRERNYSREQEDAQARPVLSRKDEVWQDLIAADMKAERNSGTASKKRYFGKNSRKKSQNSFGKKRR